MTSRILALVVFLTAGAALADRVITYSSTKSRTTDVTAIVLPDGGCAAVACGEAKQVDGGVGPRSCTQPVELSGTAQTRCLNILNSGDALWRAQEGL